MKELARERGILAEGLLGVVLAGGESRRFGGNKALAPFQGKPMAGRALDALAPHFPRCGTVANDPAVSVALGIPGRRDRVPGLGPLGGLATALEWAEEEELDGVFLLACDLPLVGPELVGRILDAWAPGALAVVPESPGPLGFEPLCAGYLVEGLPRVLEVAGSPKRSMEDALGALDVQRVPLRLLGSPEYLTRAFTNVNTRADAEAARTSSPRGSQAGAAECAHGEEEG